jgi:hypothetical protein
MSRSIHEIEHDILSLKPTEKADLIKVLIEDLDRIEENDVEQAWLEEAHRRYIEIKKGKINTISSEQAIENARARLRQ